MRVAAVVFVLFFVSSTGWGKTYEWVDEKGTVNFTQDYGSIPEKYRDRVKEKQDEPGASPKTKEKPDKALKDSPGKGAKRASHKESGKGRHEEQQVNKNRIEGDAADALKTIVSLWKDGKYEALYEYGTDASKRSTPKEKFVQKMKKTRGLASSWETLRDLDAKFQNPKLVYVTAKIGHRSKSGGNVNVLTETYPMKLEGGLWKTDLSKLLKSR